MQGDSRNGRTFGLDLDSAVVCPIIVPWKSWGLLLPYEKNSMVRDPLAAYGLVRRSIVLMASMALSKSRFRVSCDATVSIMDGAVGARGLDLAVRRGVLVMPR